MDFQQKIDPIGMGVPKALLLSLAIMVIAVGASIFSFAFMLASSDLGPAFYGMLLVWVGSITFFYAVITEEHTMKELFLRQGYFFTGLLAMIMGVFFVALSGFVSLYQRDSAVEFGVLLLILGGALILLSAQRTYDYSKANGFLSIFAGILMLVGGAMAESRNIAFGGVFLAIFGAVWLGLRDRYAQ